MEYTKLEAAKFFKDVKPLLVDLVEKINKQVNFMDAYLIGEMKLNSTHLLEIV